MKASILSFRAAVLMVIAGMIWGIVMGISQDHSTMPAHAHLNLLGWVSLFLFGIYYHLHPAVDLNRLALVQVWICAGFRSPGLRDYPHAPAAGDRKAPRHEVAGSWALAGSERYGDLMWARRLILVRTPARRHLHVCTQERSGECPGCFDRLSGRITGRSAH